MQRIRAGLTGLALVLLVTLLGSLAYSPGPPRSGPSEPLSELGVAPAPAPSRPAPEPPRAESPVADHMPALSPRADQVSI